MSVVTSLPAKEPSTQNIVDEWRSAINALKTKPNDPRLRREFNRLRQIIARKRDEVRAVESNYLKYVTILRIARDVLGEDLVAEIVSETPRQRGAR